ncbi:MAG: hypothetical protein ACYDHM_14865 [Acidiferrobacterales bacterium]
MPAGKGHIPHVAADSTHAGSIDDLCCTAAPHTVALVIAQKFNIAAAFIPLLVLPVIATSLTVLTTATNRKFIRNPRLGGTENSPRFWTLWPQAPPR